MEIKTLPCNKAKYGSKRPMDNLYIIIHYTGNDGDTALNNATYYHRDTPKTSAHFFVDDKDIYSSVPLTHTAYSVGGDKYESCSWTGGGTMHGIIKNTNSINIEMCDNSPKDGKISITEKTRKNTEDLVVDLMLKYNIPLERIYRHFDVTGKICPAYFVPYGEHENDGQDYWEFFKANIKEKYEARINKNFQDILIEKGILDSRVSDADRIWNAKLLYNTLKFLKKI